MRTSESSEINVSPSLSTSIYPTGLSPSSDGMLGFFDGVNEKGFAAATLYFSGYAKYKTQSNYIDKEPISSLDFLHYILGRCGSVE